VAAEQREHGLECHTHSTRNPETVADLLKRNEKKWRRERDSNPRYPFGYSGFQVLS